jgi:hypothetical protein
VKRPQLHRLAKLSERASSKETGPQKKQPQTKLPTEQEMDEVGPVQLIEILEM